MADDFEDEFTEHEESDEDRNARERMGRVERKFEAFLEDIADDVIEPELLEKISKKLQKELRKGGVAPSFMNIKSFALGFNFGMKSTMKLGGEVAQLMIGIKKLVKDKEAMRPKVEIDITKSLPLSDDHGTEK